MGFSYKVLLWVECLDCGTKRNLSGATQPENFEELHCLGHHPFRPTVKNEKCSKIVIPSQRGASNVYFPVIRSAISIPPWINPIYNLLDEHYKSIIDLRDVVPNAEEIIYNKYFKESFSKKDFDEAIKLRETNIKEFTDIKTMEFKAITHFDDPMYQTNKKHYTLSRFLLLRMSKFESAKAFSIIFPHFATVGKNTRHFPYGIHRTERVGATSKLDVG